LDFSRIIPIPAATVFRIVNIYDNKKKLLNIPVARVKFTLCFYASPTESEYFLQLQSRLLTLFYSGGFNIFDHSVFIRVPYNLFSFVRDFTSPDRGGFAVFVDELRENAVAFFRGTDETRKQRLHFILLRLKKVYGPRT